MLIQIEADTLAGTYRDPERLVRALLYLSPRYPNSRKLTSPRMFDEVRRLLSCPERTTQSLTAEFRCWRRRNTLRWEEMKEKAARLPHYLEDMVSRWDGVGVVGLTATVVAGRAREGGQAAGGGHKA